MYIRRVYTTCIVSCMMYIWLYMSMSVEHEHDLRTSPRTHVFRICEHVCEHYKEVPLLSMVTSGAEGSMRITYVFASMFVFASCSQTMFVLIWQFTVCFNILFLKYNFYTIYIEYLRICFGGNFYIMYIIRVYKTSI